MTRSRPLTVLCCAFQFAVFAGSSGTLQDRPGMAQANAAASIGTLRERPQGHRCNEGVGTFFASDNVHGRSVSRYAIH
jgi:hypothetical protein